MPNEGSPVAIGVLALQGSFAEHVYALQSIATRFSPPLQVVAVRTPTDLAQCKALIIPGGESTTISLLIRKSGLYEPLREMVRVAKEGGDRALWGTCAGMILLAKEIDGPTSEGWGGLDGMDVRVARNQYGRQPLVRIPAELVPSNPRALKATGGEAERGPDADVVMARQGNLLVCSWHPELNKDDARVHEWWVREMVFSEKQAAR
ncbi:Senecionine N-oxygenase [Rhodosporidiobolus nylandii]